MADTLNKKKGKVSDMSEIFREALEKYNPSSVWALFSGGNDSLAVAHLISKLYPDFKVAHIDTGIGIKATQEFVIETCEKYGWPLTIFNSPYQYKEIVKTYGFPGPQQHQKMYIKLKERCIEQLVREYKQVRQDRILLVTGARRDESTRRMGNVKPVMRRGCQVWVNAIYDWSVEKRDKYISGNNLKVNPVCKILGYSGECLCGAYAYGKNGLTERSLIDTFFPDEAAELKRLEKIASDNGHFWKWHEKPPAFLKEIKNGQAFMPMCFNCLVKKEG